MKNKHFKFMRAAVITLLAAGVTSAQNSPPALDAPADKAVIYSPVGKRDPFKPAIAADRNPASASPLEKFSIDQLQLRAILRDTSQVKALFEDPTGMAHIISEGEIIGREHGKVSRILDSSVIVTERTFNYLGAESLYEKVISLPQN
jgi:Tfp pilus assembly protein PilP